MANLVAMNTDQKLAEVTDAIGATMPTPPATPKLTPRLDALEVVTSSFASSLASLVLSVAALLTFSTRFRTGRKVGPNLLVGAVADVVIPFATAFPDTDYTVTHSVYQVGTLAGILTSSSVVAQTTSSVTIRVKNVGVLAMTPTVHVIAIHD